MVIHIEKDRLGAIQAAIQALDLGNVIAVPTETVYGLAADATNDAAVRQIFAIKQRPSFNPLICHCSDLAMLSRYAVLDPMSEKLARSFWPGPMTIVLPMRAGGGLPSVTTAGLPTVAIRIPAGFTNELIASFGRPIAAPSANISGRVTATSASHVVSEFGAAVSLVLDDGPTKIGVESTILTVEGGRLRLLRPGGLSVEHIAAVTGFDVDVKERSEPIIAPGMLTSHYAPKAAVRLNAASVMPGEAVLAFGQLPRESCNAVGLFNLSETSNLDEAARNLYAMLKQADQTGANAVAVAPIPNTGIGLAINDRLRRAAAPRS